MVVPNKQRIVTKILTQLGKNFDETIPEDLTVLDHLLIGVLQEETSFSNAHQSFKRLKEGFHDLNEMRVSHPTEIAELVEGVPEPEKKAKRIINILQFVFETTYSFDLETMRRKPLKQAQKQLSKITGTSDFTVAATVQRALGGHAIPVDNSVNSVLTRLELVDEGTEPVEARGVVEHLVPKAKGTQFALTISAIAAAENREELIAPLAPKAKKKQAKKPTEVDEAPKPKKKSRPSSSSETTKKKSTSKSKK